MRHRLVSSALGCGGEEGWAEDHLANDRGGRALADELASWLGALAGGLCARAAEQARQEHDQGHGTHERNHVAARDALRGAWEGIERTRLLYLSKTSIVLLARTQQDVGAILEKQGNTHATRSS